MRLHFFWREKLLDVLHVDTAAPSPFVSINAPRKLALAPVEQIEAEVAGWDPTGTRYSITVEPPRWDIDDAALARFPSINGYLLRVQ
jgi:hypothetical protein